MEATEGVYAATYGTEFHNMIFSPSFSVEAGGSAGVTKEYSKNVVMTTTVTEDSIAEFHLEDPDNGDYFVVSVCKCCPACVVLLYWHENCGSNSCCVDIHGGHSHLNAASADTFCWPWMPSVCLLLTTSAHFDYRVGPRLWHPAVQLGRRCDLLRVGSRFGTPICPNSEVEVYRAGPPAG